MVLVGHGYVQHTGAGLTGDRALPCHTYVIPEKVYLKNVVAFVYDDSFRQAGKKTRGQQIDLCSDDEDPSDPNAEKTVNEDGHLSEWGRNESNTGHWDLITAGVEILED